MRGAGRTYNRDAPRQRLPKAKAIRRESEGRGGGCEHHSSRQLEHHERERETYHERKLMVLRFQSPEV